MGELFHAVQWIVGRPHKRLHTRHGASYPSMGQPLAEAEGPMLSGGPYMLLSYPRIAHAPWASYPSMGQPLAEAEDCPRAMGELPYMFRAIHVSGKPGERRTDPLVHEMYTYWVRKGC